MIAVFAGTSDGREIIKTLLEKGEKLVIFTATDYGGDLVECQEGLIIYTKPLDKKDMSKYIGEHKVKKVIDATHPYATQVSQNIMDICSEQQINYYRYERPKEDMSGVKNFNSYEDIIQALQSRTGKILLTIGSNHLHLFTENLPIERLVARVLPTTNVIEKCKACGLKPSQIIGMQGPFSIEMNQSILKDYRIAFLVTKNSGKEGGTLEKIKAAKACDVQVYSLKRPDIIYRNCYTTIENLLVALSTKKGKQPWI